MTDTPDDEYGPSPASRGIEDTAAAEGLNRAFGATVRKLVDDYEPGPLDSFADSGIAETVTAEYRRQAEAKKKAVKEDEDKASFEALLPFLKVDRNGNPRPILSNAMVALQRMPELRGISVWDEFKGQYALTRSPPIEADFGEPLRGPYPRDWDDGDVVWMQVFISGRLFANFSEGVIRGAMLAVAKQNHIHPARDEMDRLQGLWDGKPRLDSWMHDCLGVERGAYEDAVAAKTLIAAVRRVRQPGCKVDTITVLQGSQGIRKSSAIRLLFGARFYSDNIPLNWADKDAAIGMQGRMVMEVAEIEKVLEGQHSAVAKAFASRSVDSFRPPYGKTTRDFPRQCVMIGTTNQAEFLIDQTGNRRYWPVACAKADIGLIEEIREQLWAEAAAREDLGEAHWLTEDAEVAASVERQAEAEHVDPWTDRVSRYLDQHERTQTYPHPDWVTTGDVLEHGMMIPPASMTRQLEMRAGRVLRSLGWVRDKIPPHIAPGRPRGYHRPDRGLF
jgi:predicted P-loop ATPase